MIAGDHSIKGLRALEAVARRGTVTLAAEELNVSPGAITHRVRDLEAAAGGRLLERRDGRFLPTAKGKRVLKALENAFDLIRDAQRELDRGNATGTIHILAPTSFATLWLLPRLSQFEELRRRVNVRLQADDMPWRHSQARTFDIVIQDAPVPPDDRGWIPLFRDPLMVVGAPATIAATQHPAAASWHDVQLIQTDTDDRLTADIYSWEAWRARIDAPPVGALLRTSIHVTQACMAIAQAVRGRGLTLATRSLVADHLTAGSLEVLAGSQTVGPTYWLSAGDSTQASQRHKAAFVDWLRETARRDGLDVQMSARATGAAGLPVDVA